MRSVLLKLREISLSACVGVAILGAGWANAATPPIQLPAVAKVDTKTEVVAGKNLRPMLSVDSVVQMQAVAERYRNILANGGFPKVPKGNYKKGSDGKGVVALNMRLHLDGYVRVEATQGEYASVFTSATEDGVRRFQRNMGLVVTGKVDQTTLYHLNIPASERLRTIEANIPRIEEYTKELGDRYLVVNIPGQQIETVTNGRVYSRHNAIVGRPARPSPVVITALSDINFNPYWNAPVSIVEADIMPKLRSGTQILEDMNIRVFKGFGGPEVDPGSVNWRSAVPDDYHFRQEPGEGNAMATAKINFRSPFGIYLHDTPEKQLFASSTRFYSSGCVRVDDMSGLINWVVNGQEGIDENQIASLAETLERKDVKLETPPQLRVVYLTAWPVGSTVAFRHDIYELDGTGFVLGQPMPVGEISPDGQRYVLKPLPRLVSNIEEGNSSGFTLFGKKRPPGSKSFFNLPKEGDDETADAEEKSDGKKKPAQKTAAVETKPAVKKLTFGSKRKAQTATLFDINGNLINPIEPKGTFDSDGKRKKPVASKEAKAKPKSIFLTSKKPVKTAAKKGGKETLGVFDWDAYRAKQAKEAARKSAKADGKKCKPGFGGKLPAGCKVAAKKAPKDKKKKS